jgi:citrate lyase beta subunit
VLIPLTPPLSYRSLIFVPADDPERLRTAFACGADAVVADLEDGVTADRKEDARRVLLESLPGSTGAAQLVRVNAADSEEFEADLDALRRLSLAALVLPKATPAGIDRLDKIDLPVIAVIETAAGLREAYEVASASNVAALALGAGDLALELRLEQRADATELLYARSKLVADSAAAGVRAPFDRVYPHFDDPEGLEEDAAYARSLGFGGKNCTHFDQPRVVNAVFGAGRYDAAAAKAAIYQR